MTRGDNARGRRRLAAVLLALPALGALELVLRAVGFQYPPLPPIIVWNAKEDADLMRATALHQIDPRTLWSPRPGAEVPWGDDERVGAQGFRGRDPDPEARPRVLALGDSSTFGYGVRGEETWAARLETALARELPRAQVVNGGLIGSTIEQGWQRYLAVRERWRPDVVVLAFGAINEHWPSSGLDDASKLAQLRQAGGARRPSPLARLRAELRIVQLAAWVADQPRGGRGGLLQERAQSGARDVGTYLEPGYLRRVSPEQFEAALERFRAALAADGACTVLLRMPRRVATEEERPAVLDYDPRLADFAARTGTPLVDAHEDFRAAPDGEAALFVDPYHPSALGHERLARQLLPAVRGCLEGASASLSSAGDQSAK